MPTLKTIVATLVALLLLTAPSALAQSAENVAIVINEQSEHSQRIGDHYIRARSIPESNIIRVRTTAEENITYAAYTRTIEDPIAVALRRNALHDRILYIVLTKGIPLRIAGTAGLEGTLSSVDSELTLLYRRMTGRTTPLRGSVANPYYLGTSPVRNAEAFSHRKHDVFLVTRLDGFTVDDVLALIDRAETPAKEGRFVLDQRASLVENPIADKWLAEAARRLADLGLDDRVVLESTMQGARAIDGVLGFPAS